MGDPRLCSLPHDGSRIGQPFQLTAYTPGGVTPVFAPGGNVILSGSVILADDGTLSYQAEIEEEGLYILGSSAVRAVDLFGGLFVLGRPGSGRDPWWAARLQRRTPQERTPGRPAQFTCTVFMSACGTGCKPLTILGLLVHRIDHP